MSHFTRSNKTKRIHWIKQPPHNLKISITIKSNKEVLLLPKYDDITKISNLGELAELDNLEMHNFSWQEKVFSLSEFQCYADIHNCMNETELKYNEMIHNCDLKPSKIFSYVNEDLHSYFPFELEKNQSNVPQTMNLNFGFECLSLREPIEKLFGRDASSLSHLFRSEENLGIPEVHWTAMHIMFDNSQYNEDNQVLLKQECHLLSLYYNTEHNFIIVYPDVNDFQMNPYAVETDRSVRIGYNYAVYIDYGETVNGEDLSVLLRKLSKKLSKIQEVTMKFVTPPLGIKHYFLFMEIVSANNFDMNNLYVEFNFKIPKKVRCNDELHGRTHVSQVMRTEDVEQWNFGQTIELCLETAVGSDPLKVQVYFEVISKDYWSRHRTEGYAYLALSLQPGYFSKQLSCCRPEEKNKIESENRRFFVGGCNLIKDMDLLTNSKIQDATYDFTTTGNIKIKWNVISQANPIPEMSETSDAVCIEPASELLLGAEAVLRKYKKARARLAEATKGLDKFEDSDDG